MIGRARLAGLAVAAACAACTSTRAAPCPGEPIAGLTLHLELVEDGGGCAFVQGSDPDRAATDAGVKPRFDLAATFATATDGAMLLCPGRPEASPLRGTLVGDQLSVAAPIVPATIAVSTCPCSAQGTLWVSERLDGTLVRGEDGSVSFTGTLRDVLSLTDGVDPATCEPPSADPRPAPRCGAPCELRWSVSGSRS